MKPDPKYNRIVDFFNTHKEGKYNGKDITTYFINTYDCSYIILREGWTLEQTIRGQISSVLSQFYSDNKEYNHIKPLRNFSRELIKNEYYYWFDDKLCNLVLPEDKPSEKTPIQIAFDFEEPKEKYIFPLYEEKEIIEESPIEEETINSPLFEDVKTLDKLNVLELLIQKLKLKISY
jgi:hypothetical protein